MDYIPYYVYSDTCPRCGGYVRLGDSHHIPYRNNTGICRECGLVYPANFTWKLLYKLRIVGREDRKEWKEVKKPMTKERLKDIGEDVCSYLLLGVLFVVIFPFAVIGMIFGGET